LLHQIIDHLSALAWGHIDAVLLPGGFFCIPALPRQQNYNLRVRAIYQAGIGDVCQQATRELDGFATGAQLVVGVDTLQRWTDENGDQFCVAFSPGGTTGLARKVFPTEADTSFAEAPPMLVYAEDYSAPQRFISLASGGLAALCACYDAFGFGGAATGHYGTRQSAIRYIWSGKAERQFGEPGFNALRNQCLADWEESLTRQKPIVVLAAIHGFRQLSLSSRWQRHGLATASAALDGAVVVGAAHIKAGWPSVMADPASTMFQSTLAAAEVPASHLGKGIYRRSHFLPADQVAVFRPANLPKVLLRRFHA
jgi:hypothetical protein